MDKKVEAIAVTGFYGQDNFGDDLFEFFFNSELRKTGAKVTCYGAGPLRPGSEANCGFVGRTIYGRNALVNKVLRVITNIKMVLTSDLIVYGGGSVFGKYASFRQRYVVAALAKIFRKKLWAIGVSIGPFVDERQEKAYVKVLRGFDNIVVRDKASLEVLDRSPISPSKYKLLPDVAFLTPAFIGGQQERRGGEVTLVLAVHLREYSGAVIDFIKSQGGGYEKIIVISLEGTSNCVAVDLYETVKTQVGVRVGVNLYNGPSDFLSFCDLIKNASYVITSKLHGSIVAAAYGVPFHVFCYQEKCTDLVEMLDYQQFNRKFLSIAELPAARAAIGSAFTELELDNYGIKC